MNEEVPTENPQSTVTNTLWRRKGPIAMAVSSVLTMILIFVNWVSLQIDIPDVISKSGSYSGWALFLPRILFFLLIIPLVLSLLMSFGIGTRRRVLETNLISFVSAFYLLVLIMSVGMSYAIEKMASALDTEATMLNVKMGFVPWLTIVLFVVMILGLIFTNIDRGKELGEAGSGKG